MPTYLSLSFQLAVAGVLLVSAVAKTRSTANQETWQVLLGQLGQLGRRVSPRAASHAHVAAEFVVGAALLLGPLARVPALTAAAVMLGSFTLLAAYSALSGRAIRCPCFGRSSTPLGWPHAVRNLVLTAMAALALAGDTPDVWPSPGEAVLAAASAMVAVLLSVFLDDILDLLRTPVRPDPGRAPRPL
ncbi:MauE/DoxX family redox-associated membrane protein [Nocardiopsis sp. NPDC058789]|uniref:MauE/DoxX family redox-associated membrane protein n=1 Tax=Nocardiopsis sp. NPDC058789 TaxID=3346634 RepID=UPI00366F56F7